MISESTAAGILAIIIALPILDHITGGPERRSEKKEREREEQMRREREEKRREKYIREAPIRNQLIKDRKKYEAYVIWKNEKSRREHGYDWDNLEEAMINYDSHKEKEWKEVGMTPPSYTKYDRNRILLILKARDKRRYNSYLLWDENEDEDFEFFHNYHE